MRYLPLTAQDRTEMLRKIGVASVADLYSDIPQGIRQDKLLDLPMHASELEVERKLSLYANQNRPAGQGAFFLGAGCYYHHIPASVDYIIQRSEFLTAYTPYQPEIAQGTLQVIFEYQSMICQLTGMDVANASMYDGATALAEAALMAMRLTGRSKVSVATPLHPHYREVLDSYMGNLDAASVVESDAADDETACIIVQSPDFFGTPHAYDAYRKACDASGAKLIVVINEIVSLGMLPAPVEADIVCGEAQSIGLPMSYGGPHLGFFAAREAYIRQMPGRLCGETVDADGRRSYVLTLSTREQHIRREKATSNICTNQGLCALAFTAHLALLGEDGFTQLARVNHERAVMLADALAAVKNVEVENRHFFNEFVIRTKADAYEVQKELIKRNIIGGLPLDGHRLLLCATEMVTVDNIDALVSALQELA